MTNYRIKLSMKKSIITLLVCLMAIINVALAQTDSNSSEDSSKPQIFTQVEVNPEFPGGEEALFKFLGVNTKYPRKAKKKGKEGIVYVQFVVEVDGSIGDIEILRSVHKLLDEEAVRVIRSMPRWEPGKQRGEDVRVYYKLPFRFRLV